MGIFIHEGRLRSGWRLLLHTLMVLIFTFLVGIPVFLIAGGTENFSTQQPAETYLIMDNRLFLISQLSFAIGLTMATFLARRWLDKKSFRSLGVWINPSTFVDLLVGFWIAGLMMGGIFLVLVLLGWLQFEGFIWQKGIPPQWGMEVLSVFILFVLVGWTEELLSRGYQLQNLVEGLKKPAGVIVSSLIFAILHQSNPSFSFGAFVGLFLAGLFFCYAYYLVGNLWLPIGLHIGWNFFEGVVFGFQVSGLDNLPKLILQNTSGPQWITGGAFGPEAGLILVVGLAIGVALLVAYRRRFGERQG